VTVLLLVFAATAAAQPADPLAPLPQAPTVPVQAEPIIVQPSQVQPQPQPQAAVIAVPKDWRGVFDAIRAGNWASAQAGVAALPPGPLTAVAKSELYTAKGSPTVDLGRLQALLAEAPDLPNADQLARMAVTRGATTPPLISQRRAVISLASAPRRYRARAVGGEPLADALRAQLDPLLKADLAADAEAAFLAQAPYLSANARAEAAQRIAWTYYGNGDDFNARRVADYWRAGAGGEWGAQAAWVSGLASWRLNDCNSASRAFREVAATATQRELGAGGYYWAARAEQACRRPQSVQGLLKAAAASPESFYGLIARETLGTDTRLPPAPPARTEAVDSLPNVRRAAELAAIGERSLAEDMLRHQARIGNPGDHSALIEAARRLDLPGAQYWLAHNGQRGVSVPAAARYPMPRWAPSGGWRIDPALAFAHARQESDFRPTVVSPAGAVGRMQVRPGTAGDFARQRGTAVGNLAYPPVNLEYGQSFIELMRRTPATQGQLLKIMAAYNAGPVPVSRWNYIKGGGDPILWIESLSYWETRYYVPAVLRNLWVYEGISGRDSTTLKAVAQHRWPEFPAAH